MCALYNSDAVVIRSRDYRDYDKIINLFTPYYGRVSAVVKGVKKPKSKLAGIVQSFTYGNYQLYSGKSLGRLVQGKVLHGFQELRTDLVLMSAGMCILELIDKAIPEGEEYPALFGVTLSCFHLLEKSYPPSLVLRIFEAKLIHNLGVSPELSGCINHGSITQGNLYFDPETGGLICETCFEQLTENRGPGRAFPVEKGSINIIKRMFEFPVYKLRTLKPTQLQYDTLEKMLTSMLEVHFGIVCKTKPFFKTNLQRNS
ncbi:DNA repair protein RecO [Natranaerobius thermophilus]|uniref:DNA repair protein RecO n=1 Tax=Natranaerobius thermophilus (strain ATCC BAA-1301 / DSM 18059 / JW/NM-WN-LF) TaxID=457570 RepID=B2A1Y4_NATTJ|nr:DNA repair protein RecO [Natranaerobius thermophilus]ACB84789.1 DNA repair protein RecO [Natranaerobius thermophilus JW/NM-WN-LF]